MPELEYEKAAAMNTIAAQPVDPTTVDSLLTMCVGALDGLERSFSALQNRIQPILQEVEPQDTIERFNPQSNCELGSRIVNLARDIMVIENRIETTFNRVRL